MGPSPTANRSFLHGSGNATVISDKLVYATLDSLALKRARLPLQLLPADEGNVVEKMEKREKDRMLVGGKTLPKRPSYKVKSGASDQWKSYSKCLVFSSTKMENQSMHSTKILDSAIERDIGNILKEECQMLENTNPLKNFVKISSSSPIDKDSHDKYCQCDDNLNSSEAIINEDDVRISADQREKKKCYISRTNSNSSSDYEKMNVTDSIVSTRNIEKLLTTDFEVTNDSNFEYLISNNKKKTLVNMKIATKSNSMDNLMTTETIFEKNFRRYSKQDMMSIGGDDDDIISWDKKKKKRFTRNVLHYVPKHLVKQPKKQKKKKHATSFSSVKPPQTTSKNIQDSCRTRSLSREELKGMIISPPTNFIHVASATNPSLVLNENIVRSSLEQVVITHQQICATLPLLVGKDERYKVGNENTVWSKAIGRMSPANMTSSQAEGKSVVENIADKTDRTNYVEIKSDCPWDQQSEAAKVLESSQVVKTVIENQADSPEGETYEPVCETSLPTMPTANCSFLWSNHQAKNFPNDKCNPNTCYPLKNNDENTTNKEYDDVGSSNSAAQAGSDYDDVDLPTNSKTKEVAVIAKDHEEIYDDVMPFACKQENSTVDESDYLIPETDEEVSGNEPLVELRIISKNYDISNKEPFVELRTTSKSSEVSVAKLTTSKSCKETSHLIQNNDRYFSANNEYSSVNGSHLGDEERDELDVYDDVGLPAEERVNSLYAGSTPSSVLGLTSMNSKESEWEDLEEVSSISHCPCQNNKPCENGAGGQVVPSKKKFVQRWSRKARRQRSRRSRRNTKASARTTANSTIYVAVSLGGGSILLIGEPEKITEEWKIEKLEENYPRRTQGLVQLRVVNLDEDMDVQETSCYVHEDSASDDSTYESLYACQTNEFNVDSEIEANETRQSHHDCNRLINTHQECPTRPTPPPPREASLTQTLGKRIKMLRRTWSITKGSLGRIRRRASADECFDEKESSNEHHNIDKYFNFRRHFRKSIASSPTFYLDENNEDNIGGAQNNNNGKETIYTNSQYMGSSSDDYSKTRTIDIDHYSILADQEPLYQFYAAAVARVAFESDSEGYEEVEDMMWKIKPSTTDLAKAGQRMLWCHTPQVIHSGLLQRLTSEERKIQEAKFEILTSEASYLNSLRVLENEFLNNHTLINEILTPIEKKKLFGGVPSVLSASQMFLAELETVWRGDPMLPGLSDVLLRHAEKCQSIYVAYCSNQVSIDTTLKELRARKGIKFLETVKRVEMRPACQNLSLHSFLMLPMQRVTRLPLLADAVLSKLSVGNSERTPWEKVLSSLSNVVAECNEGARSAVQEAEMEVLARKLEYSTKIKPIMLRGKRLVRSGSVVQLSMKTDTEYKLTFGKKFNKTPLYLLLLTDYLLVTKLKSKYGNIAHDESYTVVDACKRNLLALESASEESPFAGRNAMILTLLENHSGRHVEYILTCENNTERERWLEAVSPSKRGLVGETLYESWDCPQVMAMYPYSPNQPDELSLQPGDVINVLRKMADGWYHGEKLLDSEQGWFPANHTKEVASEHVRARNLKQRHRLLALSSSVLQQRRAKQNSGIH